MTIMLYPCRYQGIKLRNNTGCLSFTHAYFAAPVIEPGSLCMLAMSSFWEQSPQLNGRSETTFIFN